MRCIEHTKEMQPRSRGARGAGKRRFGNQDREERNDDERILGYRRSYDHRERRARLKASRYR